MKKLLAILVLVICTSQLLHNYQMRNIDNLDNGRMQRYVEHININGELNSYDRR